MIEIKNMDKNFGSLQILADINLKIEKGEIFGIIGLSGAGKSTLLRCINGLETYHRGSVKVMDTEVANLGPTAIRELRRNLGMIFQNFNLLNRKNVFDNIAIPMEIWGFDKSTIKERVFELLKLVDLEDKAYEKPARLSGGQKQRVAIARALALKPEILLCDEATSALDPKTTKSILELLREINKKLGLTIVIVTHQMEVIKDICSKVALIEDGRIITSGYVEDIFLNPDSRLKNLLGEEELLPYEGVNIKLYFPKEKSCQCIISSMARELDKDFSIVWGKLEKFSDHVLGNLIINVNKQDQDLITRHLDNKSIHWEVL
mgnify:FL=1